MVAGRPYPDLSALLATADARLAGLSWPEVTQALAGHPRIGERPAGSGRAAAWSRREQAQVARSGATRDALAEANRAYEARFGRIFLVFASGRTDAELLAAARQRLGNDEPTEQAVVRVELAKITRRRLMQLWGGGEG